MRQPKKRIRHNKYTIISLLLAFGVCGVLWVSITPEPGEAEAKAFLNALYTVPAAQGYAPGALEASFQHYAEEGVAVTPGAPQLKREEATNETMEYLYLITLTVQTGGETVTVEEEGGRLTLRKTASGWQVESATTNGALVAALESQDGSGEPRQ